MSDSVVHSWREGAVLWAEVRRPEALNAIDFDVMSGLEAVLDEVEADDSIRVFVLRGEGTKSFISGGDLKTFAPLTSAEDARVMATRVKAILRRVELVDAFTIACINGPAYGGGCETLVAFDLRLAAEHATFGWTQTRFGVPCGWGGMTRLVERVGRSRALAWVAGCEIVDAATALDAGLIDAVHHGDDLVEAVRSRAEQLARQPRQMIRVLKQAALAAVELPREDALAAELEPFAQCWASERHHRKVQKFLDLQASKSRSIKDS